MRVVTNNCIVSNMYVRTIFATIEITYSRCFNVFFNYGIISDHNMLRTN